MFTVAFDFTEQCLMAIQGFCETKQEAFSLANIENVNKIEMLRKRLTTQKKSQAIQ